MPNPTLTNTDGQASKAGPNADAPQVDPQPPSGGGWCWIDNRIRYLIKEIGGIAAMFYLLLASMTNGRVTPRVTVRECADLLGVSTRAIQKARRKLEKALLIHRTGNRGRDGAKYTLLPLAPQSGANTGAPLTEGKGEPGYASPPTKTNTGAPRGQLGLLLRENKEEDKDSSCRKLRFDETDGELAKWIFDLIRKINPGHKEPNFDKWANTLRLMRERDGRTHAEIRELFAWANADSFWKTNILSPDKLREKWDQLTIKRTGERNGNRKHSAVGPGQRFDPDHERDPNKSPVNTF